MNSSPLGDKHKIISDTYTQNTIDIQLYGLIVYPLTGKGVAGWMAFYGYQFPMGNSEMN